MSPRSGKGANEGTLTITRPDGGQVVIQFSGHASIRRVQGDWQVIAASGSLADLTGSGAYAGNAGLLFRVKFFVNPTGGAGGAHIQHRA